MNAGLPSDEQLRRIREGVLHRIDRRRRIARGIAGGAVAVVLLSGGIGLVATGALRVVGDTASGTSSGGGRSSALAVVRCHDGATADSPSHLAKADPARLPDSAVEACATTDDLAAPAAPTSASASPRGQEASAATAAVCLDGKGDVQVFATRRPADEVCAENDATPVAP